MVLWIIKDNLKKLNRRNMDYAIVDIGGHQIWVEEGQYFAINKIEAEPGAAIDINRVLLINKDGNVHFGKPYVTNSKVKGEIMGHYRGSKILVYKMKTKKKYRRKKGHRQELTKLKVNTIEV
jgi:large subunit ribosomal protein L21|tara:strand:+ start:3079 stop:3444 length:366 start_codon:yes stop_codon:yes gene_type:complete